MKIPRTKRTYQILYLVSHLTFILYCFLFGAVYTATSLLLGLIVYNLSAELYLHRTVSHNHFTFPVPVQKTLCAMFSMCGFGSVAVNAGIHINHHKYSDTPLDPHNFRTIGLWKTLLKDWSQENLPRPRLFTPYLKNTTIRHQHNNNLNYFLAAAILCPCIPFASFWLINLLYVVVHLGNSEDGRTLNLVLLWPLMWGAEYHRDHHLYPNKKKLHNYDLIYHIGNLLSTS